MVMSKMARTRVNCFYLHLDLSVTDGKLEQSAQLIMKLLVCLLMMTVSTIPQYSPWTVADELSQCEEICISF